MSVREVMIQTETYKDRERREMGNYMDVKREDGRAKGHVRPSQEIYISATDFSAGPALGYLPNAYLRLVLQGWCTCTSNTKYILKEYIYFSIHSNVKSLYYN
jgi:hypothetical protein